MTSRRPATRPPGRRVAAPGKEIASSPPPRRLPRGPFHDAVYRVVARIPKGKVASYGQVARLAGFPGRARQVGWAMSALPDGSGVPWHRVINAKGEISPRSGGGHDELQRQRLEREGVRFSPRGVVDLERFGWAGEGIRD